MFASEYKKLLFHKIKIEESKKTLMQCIFESATNILNDAQ